MGDKNEEGLLQETRELDPADVGGDRPHTKRIWVRFLPFLILAPLLILSLWYAGTHNPAVNRFSIRSIPPNQGYPAIALLRDELYREEYPIQDLSATTPDGKTNHFSIGFVISHLVRKEDCQIGSFMPAESITQGSKSR